MPMDALKEILERDRSVASEDALSSLEVKKLKKAIRNINAIRRIADQHTGNVAQEIGTLAALAWIDLNDLLVRRDNPTMVQVPQWQSATDGDLEVETVEPAVKLKR